MEILICNAGSTSLKFKMWRMPEETAYIEGKVERIGKGNSIYHYRSAERSIRTEGLQIDTYRQGIEMFLRDLEMDFGDLKKIDAIGYKTVLSKDHYGVHELTEEVLDGMREYMVVAPAHNGPYLEAIEVFSSLLPGIRQVGSFETAFHRTIPMYRRMFPVPYEWYEKYGIMRMGYHGASHSYVASQTEEYSRTVSCHLGGSSSLCAIKDGKSMDNSFGLSLQHGILNNNRCGDLDPFVIPFMVKQGMKLDDVMTALCRDSGLKGISGTSGDMREIEEGVEKGDERCILAFNMFVDSLVRYIGAYTFFLEGLDALVFTGGIGENSSMLREAVCRRLEFYGVRIDNEKNKKNCETISTPESRVAVKVIRTDEERMVVRNTFRLLY